MKRLVIDLGSLPEEGKQIEGTLPAGIFDLGEGDPKPLSPLSYALHVQRFGNELLLQGRLAATFEFTCVRTLTPFAQTIELPRAAVSLEIDGQAEIDASEPLREELLLAFPAYPRCDEGDDPLPCEIDPRYLAVDKPGAAGVDVPPAAAPKKGDSRWAALDALDSPDPES
ncbi:MAG: DUF177 domain-containing protein [Akkermansiaceae bacterium]|nr:DUF177 domain-containing protein [Akkermansiaceae bacterium]